MVLLEALARRRPVVIFEEIKHVIGDKKVFVSRRNYSDFFETINYIKKNCKLIQKDMITISFQQTKNLLNNYQKLLT